MPLSLKNENILHLPFVIACSPNLQSAHQHGFQHVEVQIPIIPFCDFLLAGVIDLDKCEDNLNRVGQSRCQKTLRRPLVQLQQVGEAGCQYDRSTDGSNQAQALTAHRCGKCIDPKILWHFLEITVLNPFNIMDRFFLTFLRCLLWKVIKMSSKS